MLPRDLSVDACQRALECFMGTFHQLHHETNVFAYAERQMREFCLCLRITIYNDGEMGVMIYSPSVVSVLSVLSCHLRGVFRISTGRSPVDSLVIYFNPSTLVCSRLTLYGDSMNIEPECPIPRDGSWLGTLHNR